VARPPGETTAVSCAARAQYRALWVRQTVALATVVMVGALLTACTSGDPPASDDPPAGTAPTRGSSLAACRTYGVPSSPVTLRLPGMVFSSAFLDAAATAHSPAEALEAFDKKQSDGSVNASARLFIAPASSAVDRVQEGIWKANIGEYDRWPPDMVAKNEIILSPVANTTQATNVSHTTITTHGGSPWATFDYWAFASNGQRYLLSYARTPAAKTDAATFFATATGCP
jgi:hypothetical protein